MDLDLPISLHLPAETPLAFCLEISTDAGFFHFSFFAYSFLSPNLTMEALPPSRTPHPTLVWLWCPCWGAKGSHLHPPTSPWDASQLHQPMGCPRGGWDMGHPKGLSYSPSTGNLQPKPDSQGGNMPFIVGEKVSEALTRLPEQRSSAYPAANFLSNLTQENNNPGYGTRWVCF